jgi:hypothetical protein
VFFFASGGSLVAPPKIMVIDVKFRSLLKALDRTFFLGKISESRNDIMKLRFYSDLTLVYERSFTVYSRKPSKLAALCDLYGSDKGSNGVVNHPYTWYPHCYTDFYEMLFCKNKNQVNSVFECGIGTSNVSFLANMGPNGRPGASLRVWRDYFPNALVYGADIDHDVLFNEERIETFYMNQLDPTSIKNATDKFQDGVFDLMVDDGLHTYDAAITLFLNTSHLLSPGGVYVIEDVTPKSMNQLLMPGVIPEPFEIYPVSFQEVGKSQELNSLLVITRVNASPDTLGQR